MSGDGTSIEAKPALNPTALDKPPTQSQPEQDEQRGFRCSKCGCEHFRVIYTRRAWGGKIMRDRAPNKSTEEGKCRHCGRRVVTYEHVAF